MKKLLCVIGPSGSGKSTYVNYAIEQLGYGEIVSTTTRSPRTGEINGKDYHFVSKEDFDKLEMIQRDEYAGNCYGTAQKDLDEAFRNSNYAFMVVTYEGAIDFKRIFKEKNLDIEVVTIFVYTPIEVLKERMINRGDDLEKIKERIDNIQKRGEYDNKDKTDLVFEANIQASLEDVCNDFLGFIKNIK